jgi:hypothetical protein
MTPFLPRSTAAFFSTTCLTACLTTCLMVGFSSLAAVPPAGATTGPTKESPYAAATDGGVPTAAPVNQAAAMAGSVAPGTEKESPYAAAKDELALSFGPSLGKLWWLLLPTGLAAVSYVVLRSQEGTN